MKTIKTFVHDISRMYLEQVLDVSKHQDFIHWVLTHESWDKYEDAMVVHVRKMRLANRSKREQTFYVCTETREFVEAFLQSLERTKSAQVSDSL